MKEIRVDAKGNRLFKGEYERKDGRYEYRYTDLEGNSQRVYEYRLQQLRMEEARIAFREHTRILHGVKELSLNDMMELWIASKVDLKESTLNGYRRIYEIYVKNGLGKRMLEDITTADIKCFYNSLKISRSLSTETICRMPEYNTVMAMKGVGPSIGPRLIAEIGDPRRFHSSAAIIAYSGIDAPPYQSGKFTGTERHMSKRGSKIMRKIGYELLDSINKHQSSYRGDLVCEYFLRKRAEGKHYRVAMFAAYNKWERILLRFITSKAIC